MATRFGVVNVAFRNKRVRRLVLRVLPVAAALVVLLASLILVSNVQQDFFRPRLQNVAQDLS